VLRLRYGCPNQSCLFRHRLQEIFVAEKFDLGIQLFFADFGVREIHRDDGLWRNDRVGAASAQQDFEVRFIAWRKQSVKHNRQEHEGKAGGDQPGMPEQSGR